MGGQQVVTANIISQDQLNDKSVKESFKKLNDIQREHSPRENKTDDSSDDRNSELSFDYKPTFNHDSNDGTPKYRSNPQHTNADIEQQIDQQGKDSIQFENLKLG